MQKKLLLLIACTLSLSACNVKKNLLVENSNADIDHKTQKISVELEPIPDIVYYAPSEDQDNLSNNHYYKSIGLGYLGGKNIPSSQNQLTPYPSIKFNVVTEGLEKSDIKFSIEKKDLNEPCASIFKVNQDSYSIDLNKEKLEKSTNCSVTAKIETNLNGFPYIYSKDLSINFDLTFKEYILLEDKLSNSIKNILSKKYSINDSLDNFLAYLKNHELALNELDLSKEQEVEKIDNIDVLHLFKKIQRLNLSTINTQKFDTLNGLSDLQELNLSNTQITSTDLNHLTALNKIKSLNLKNTKVSDLSFFRNSFQNTETLDFSSNKIIMRSGDFSSLKHLKSINLSDSGLTPANFIILDDLRDLTTLDISQNDLSHLKDYDFDDVFNKINLNSLESLNISHSNIPNNLLNSLFEKLNGKQNFKNFSDSNVVNDLSFDARNCMTHPVHNYDEFTYFKGLTSLEHIDLSGNACQLLINNNEHFIPKVIGLSDLSLFSQMTNLKTLDISGSSVHDFIGIKDLHKLEKVAVAGQNAAQTSIPMSKLVCENSLTHYNISQSVIDCSSLKEMKKQTINYFPISLFPTGKASSIQQFKVPEGVWKIYVSGCSGANGGAGGGAGGYERVTRTPASRETFDFHYYFSQGGSSGSVNNFENKAAAIPLPNPPNSADKNPDILKIFNGKNGELGEKTSITNPETGNTVFEFPIASSKPKVNFCKGGMNGQAGKGSIVPVGPAASRNNRIVDNDGGENTAEPFSSEKIEKNLVNVTPGEILNIKVGLGGAGGTGGSGVFDYQKNPVAFYYYYLGENGTNGTAGADGFIRIEWNE